jgi:hypothetical protein
VARVFIFNVYVCTIAYLQVYKEPLCKRHYGAVASLPFLFRILGYGICLFLAVLLSYASGDMWVKRKVATGRPRVAFSYRALAHFVVSFLITYFLFLFGLASFTEIGIM